MFPYNGWVLQSLKMRLNMSCILFMYVFLVFLVGLEKAFTNANLFSPQDVPGPPEKIFISSEGENAMRVQFTPPERIKAEGNNGAPVIGYKVEVARRVNEVQTFKIEANAPLTSGSYKLTFTNDRDTGVSSCIPWNASEVVFEMALEEMLNVDEVTVIRSEYGAAKNGYIYTIIFDGKYLVSGKQPQVLTATQVGCEKNVPLNRVLTFSGERVVTGANGYFPEVWDVTSGDTSGANLLSGSFELSIGFDGAWLPLETRATIAPGSRTAITSASMVGKVNRGDSIKIGGETFTVHMTAPFTNTELPLDSYHILGTTNQPINVLDTALGNVVVNQGSSIVKTSSDFSQLIGINEHVKIGNYEFKVIAISMNSMTIDKISTNGNTNWPEASTKHITAYKRKKVNVDANAEAWEVKKAIESLPGIGSASVDRVGPDQSNGYRWRITFTSFGSKNNCPESPCLRADKKTGTITLLNDIYGDFCATCDVVATILKDDANIDLTALSGEYGDTSIVASQEVGGVIYEIQRITTKATANDLGGTFALNFRNAFTPQSPGAIINYDDTAEDVQTKLQNLPTLGRLNVTRVDTEFGYTWIVTFLSNIGDLPILIVDKTLLTGTGADVTVQEDVKGVHPTFEAIIDGLSPEQEYYVRAFAKNINGYGKGTDMIQKLGKGALPLSTKVAGPPDAPNIIAMWPISGSQLGLKYTAPVSHGSPIKKYLLEYVAGTSFGDSPIKQLYIYNSLENDFQGTFQLQYGDNLTPLLPIHITAEGLTKALNGLSNMRPVTVSRAVYILKSETSFEATKNLLTTTPLTSLQSSLLKAGSSILVGEKSFKVKTQPNAGAKTIEVESGHGVADFTEDRILLKVDPSGSERGPSGYQWSITFQSELQDVAINTYPGLQLLHTLSSVETGNTLTTLGLSNVRTGQAEKHTGAIEISTDDQTCDSYVIGQASPVQVVQLFAKTTVTSGTFKLQLGTETTSCISLGTLNTQSTIKTELEALHFVDKVTVQESRNFKVTVLRGVPTSKVTAYHSGTSKITVISTGPDGGLSNEDVAALPENTVFRVSRNPQDFSRHSCEFTVGSTPNVGDKTLAVTGTCTSFSGESRVLQVLDFHDYKIRFWGTYPTGSWPTLKVLSNSFGRGDCASWSPNVPVSSKIHTIKYEGVCASGNRATQTILADADGGSFTLSLLGKETERLSYQKTTSIDMKNALEKITSPGMVQVSLSRYGANGKAWHITFASDDEPDTIFIKHSFLTGQNALISVYPTVEVYTDALKKDISGNFQLAFGSEVTESIAYGATHAKVTQELQKLTNVASVIALGDASAGDVGVSTLKLTATATNGNRALTGVKLNGKTINPNLFLAIREKLMIGGTPYYIQSLSSIDITLASDFAGTTAVVNIDAGLITQRTRPLPGFLSISSLMNIITATKNTKIFELPADHGFVHNSKFFVNGNSFTVDTVSNGIVTTFEPYTGDNIDQGFPAVQVYDNKLRTTTDLTQLLSPQDDIWISSSITGELEKFKVSQVSNTFLLVSGTFKENIVKRKALQVGNGRKWSLVFRSFTSELDSIDVIPGNDWRGTDARIGVRRSKGIASSTLTVGNSAVRQTVSIDVKTAEDKGPYTLRFGTESTVPILWTDNGDILKAKLEALNSIDGVTVRSQAYNLGFIHTISFWGTYPTKTLPILIATSAEPDKIELLVKGTDAVAVSKQENLILANNQNYLFRLFAINSKGISNSKEAIKAQTATTSVLPSPPTSVVLGEFHGPTWLSVNYRPPFYSGGADITMYRLEWDSSPKFDSASPDYGVTNIPRVAEVQQVFTSFRSGVDMGGTFTLSWGGRTTTPLKHDCTAAQMMDALAIITETVNIAVDPVKVTRARVSWGYAWKITFLHNYGDLAPLVVDGSLLTGDFPRIVVTEITNGFNDLAIGDFTREVQEIYIDSKSLAGGYFKIGFEGKISQSISVDATALEMEQLLQETTTIYSIKVTKAWRTESLNNPIWSVTFSYLRGQEMVGAGSIFTMIVAEQSGLTGTAAKVNVAEKIYGTDPFRYKLQGLRTGVTYYFHVMAYNAEGFGSATSPLSSAVTCGHPAPPKSITSTVVDGTTLAVSWSKSDNEGGCPVDKYKIEWYRAEGEFEQQTITTSAGKGLQEVQSLTNFATSQSLSGYFKLSFGGEITENIAWNAPAIGLNSIKDRLERLSTVGTVDVTRTQSTSVVSGLFVTVNGYIATVHTSATTTIQNSGLKNGDNVWILEQNFIITISSDTTLTLDKTMTTMVPVPVFKDAFGFKWLITFQSGHVGPQELLKVFPSDSWAGDNPGIYMDSVQKGLQPISGTFTVTFASGGLSHTTAPLSYNVSADEMKKSLESLVTMGEVNVLRSTNGYGFNWVITFMTEFKDDISLLSVDGTELHGPSVKISVAQTYVGTQPSFYCEHNGASGAPIVVELPAPLKINIGSLVTGNTYAIRVRSHNVEGYGPGGYALPAFQVPRTIPSAPTNVKLLVLSSRFLKVRWDAPASNGGISITSYKIQWDQNSMFTNVNSPNYDYEGEVKTQPSDNSPFYFNIPIKTAGIYFLRVIAVNDQGEGPPGIPTPASAAPVDRTPGQAENVKASVLSSYGLLVEWSSPTIEKADFGGDGGLPITQYMIEWDTSADFDSPATFALVDGPIRSYIIGGNDPVTGVRSNILEPNTEYFIRVTAFNAMGAGSYRLAVPTSLTTVNQVPVQPNDLKLSAIPSSSIKAEWNNPVHDGGESLKSYRVEWDEQDDFSSGQSSSATIPIVREIQSLTLSSEVVNEEQFVDATVEVVNEEQIVRTHFTGADEIQVIQTTNDEVVEEVQTVVTSATDRNEVQELRLTADDVNEIQAIRSTVPDADEVLEVQTIQIGAVRRNEVQSISVTIANAVGNFDKIGGSFILSFDDTQCTHCTNKVGYRSTYNLIDCFKDTDHDTAAASMDTNLEALENIGTGSLDVTRTTTTIGNAVTFTFSITFSGDNVAGNVPELRADSSIELNGVLVTGIPTVATEETKGNEVKYDAGSTFKTIYTCESYSNPLDASSFSDACVPDQTDMLCSNCVTDFDGTHLELSEDLFSSGRVIAGSFVVAGVCVLQVHSITESKIIIDNNGVVEGCSTFTRQSIALFKAKQSSIDVPVKSAANTITLDTVVESLLNSIIINSVKVSREQTITSDFVGSTYDVTFRKLSGSIPLLTCDKTNVITDVGSTCIVNRKTIGSMIKGSFKIGLGKESNNNVVIYSAPIPWDASESFVKSTLESVVDNGEAIFGTVVVTRTVFLPTQNKWSGDFTWKIEFISRGWNIPKMVVENNLAYVDTGKSQKPSLLVEDAANPLDPPVGSRDGNQIAGTMTFTFDGITASEVCTIGTNTDETNLRNAQPDNLFASFLNDKFSNIGTVQVMRSAATQARGFTWTITFSDPENGGDVPIIGIASSALSGTNVDAKFYETVKGNQLLGTFQLKFNGETTGPILFSADKSAVQAQLNSLASIKPSSVIVDRIGPSITATEQVLSYTWLITFKSGTWADPTSDHSTGITGNWKGSRAKWDDVWVETGYSKAWGRHVGPMWSKNFQITCLSDGLTTTANDNSQRCTTNVKTNGVGPLKGTFTLTLDSSTNANFMSVKKRVTSMAIAHNAWATKEESGATGTSVEEILENMENVGDVSVSRSTVDPKTGGYTWTVTFLRDANGPCEQEEDDKTVRLCNSPGDVPAMTVDASLMIGANPHVTVYEKTLNNDFGTTIQNGLILRGDFTAFKVTNDPGFASRYKLTIACTIGAAPPCDISTLNIAAGSELVRTHLLVGDRFTLGEFTSCVFKVTDFTETQQIKVTSLPVNECTQMQNVMSNNNPRGINILVPWNAAEDLVQRVLEASSDKANEYGVWKGGRKVSVTRNIHGKYGEVSWKIRFISNPLMTPPGAGNIPDVATTFEAIPASTYQITVTQVTPGSLGLSGSFLIDYRSTLGPREIAFDESEDRLQRKLNEMNTIGRVVVKKFKYPSTSTGCTDSLCSGGWDDIPVDNAGTRGGYRWRIRFLKVMGEYGGLTFPSGSGNVGPISVYLSKLGGNEKSIDVTTNVPGSFPILGSFVLTTTSKTTPFLPYSSTAETIKQGIESMNLFGDVDVTRELLVNQRIPNALATLYKDGNIATITGVDDIRQFVAPGDVVRFGPPMPANSILDGTNGDSLITGALETSKGTTSTMSPIVQADKAVTKVVFPDQMVRIDGLVYEVQRSGHEIQQVIVSLPTANWNPTEAANYFRLGLSKGGSTQVTSCFPFNVGSADMEAELIAKLKILDATATNSDIKVTRTVGAIPGSERTGYTYSIYFLGDSVTGDIATLTAKYDSCTVLPDAQVDIKTITHGGKIPYQRLTLSANSGEVIDTMGYFQLELNTAYTSCMTWGVHASDLEKEIEEKLHTGNVIVSRRGSGASVTEIQRLRMTSNSEVTTTITGLFQLQLTIDGKTAWTNCLAYGISADALQNEMNQLNNIAGPHIRVTRDGDGSSTWGYGFEYLIHFSGSKAGGYSSVVGNMNQLEIVNAGTGSCAPVASGDPALIVETIREGSSAYTYDIFFLDYPSSSAPLLSIKDERDNACKEGWRHDGGSARKAKIETINIGGSGEVQKLIVKDSTAAINRGSYKITFNGQTTTNCIPFNAFASDIENALIGLSTIGSKGVYVLRDTSTVNAPNGFVYTIQFVGDLVTGNIPQIDVTYEGCNSFASSASVVPFTDSEGGQHPGQLVLKRVYDGEKPAQHTIYSVSQLFSVMDEKIGVQMIVVSNPENDIEEATYRLDLSILNKPTLTTNPIKWDATDAEMEKALTMSYIADGDIVVTRRTDATIAPNGYVYYVYFKGESVRRYQVTLTVKEKIDFKQATVTISTKSDGADAPLFESNIIPLASASSSMTASKYIGPSAQWNVYKVNGFMWNIKFKSTIGNIPALGIKTDDLSGGNLKVYDDFVAGSSSNSYVISNLLPGINYYVRVAATTDIGLGPFTSVKSFVPSGVGNAVENIASGPAMFVREVQEIRIAATHITEIQSITTSAAKMSEVQTFRTYADPTTCFTNNCINGKFAFRVPTVQTIKVEASGPIEAGSYSLEFKRYEADPDVAGSFRVAVGEGAIPVVRTENIPWNADAEVVKTKLEALDTIDDGDIIVTRDGDASLSFKYGYVYQITFVGNKVAGETEQISIFHTQNGCGNCAVFQTTGNVAYTLSTSMNTGMAMGTDTAVQEVIVKADKELFTGSYKLGFEHLGTKVYTSCINFDAPAGGDEVNSMKKILEDNTNIDKVYVTRKIDPVNAPNGYIYRIFFYGNGVYGDVNMMEVQVEGCSPFQTQVNNVLTEAGVNAQVTISVVDEGGFNPNNDFVDATLASADTLKADLDRLPVFGQVITTRSLVDEQGGFVWTVVFKDSHGNVPQFICAVDPVFSSTIGTSCESSTVTDGNVLSGTFVLDSSVPIAYDADAATVKSALEAMVWVGTVQVVRLGPSAQLGYTWIITFMDHFGDVADLSVTSSLVGTANSITVKEIRKGNSVGGNFTLGYLDTKTTPIQWNARATSKETNNDGSSMQEKLEALDGIGPLRVTRSYMDAEGGFTWLVTFLDDKLNSGDLPLLKGDASKLTGIGISLTTAEVVKGSYAVGDELWISFDPPAQDNGSPVTKYQVRWDTSNAFTASPSDFFITESEKLLQKQSIVLKSPSLAWSQARRAVRPEIQTLTIANSAQNTNTFELKFRGDTTRTFTIGTSTVEDLLKELNDLITIGTVTIIPSTGQLIADSSWSITFNDEKGDLPLLVSSNLQVATVAETQAGITNYRKEIFVFSCQATTGTTGTVTFTYGAKTMEVDVSATIANTKNTLISFFDVEADGLTVTSDQHYLCAEDPEDVKIVFHSVYGDINLQVASTYSGIVLTKNIETSIDGVFNDFITKVSGTFQVGYKGSFTRSLNAESSAADVRYAIEDLISVDTVGVTRDFSYQPLSGKLDVVKGEIFVTCSVGEVCDFQNAGYGLPGHKIRLDNTWYTIRTDNVDGSLPKSRLYLGDMNGREIAYKGPTMTGVVAYEWAKGYIWTVSMLRVTQPLEMLRGKIPRLYPLDSNVRIYGSSCNECYYIPNQTTKKLTMGQDYFVEVYGYNENGKGLAPVGGPLKATPSQVPNAPSNVDLIVVSGKEIEVFFAPPALSSVNVHPSFNNDITSYIVQWDTVSTFKHGLPMCIDCAASLKDNILTTTTTILALKVGSKFTIADEKCPLEVQAISGKIVYVFGGHNCDNFNSRLYPLYYYTFEPVKVSGLAIEGAAPFRYLITGLKDATQYFVRVAAVNSVPTQQIALDGNPPDNRKWSFPLSATTKNTVPDPPVSVFLYIYSGTTLEVQIQPPQRDGKGTGGAAITHYWIDIDKVSSFDSSGKTSPKEIEVTGNQLPSLFTNGPRIYYIKNLEPGTRYFVQVKAKNSIGYSRATLAPNPLAPVRNPDAPMNVKVSTVTSSSSPIDSATVTWQKPALTGGLPLTSYKIEWWGVESRPEIQVVEIKWVAQPSSAYFTLAFGGGLTGSLPFDVTPENLRNALMNIMYNSVQKIQHVDVTRSAINVDKGYQWRITFNNGLNVGDIPMIQFEMVSITDGTQVTARVFEAQSGINVPQASHPGKKEVQVLVTSHPTSAVGGYFRLSYKGSPWSNYLPASIGEEDLRFALESLPTIGKVSVNLMHPSQNGQVWSITFESNVGNLPPLIIDSTKITPNGAFVGIKDGDNEVTKTGLYCYPGGDICSDTQETFATDIANSAAIGESAVEYGFYETIDANVLTYKITGLTPGKAYFVAVSAKNSLGLGPRMASTPLQIVPLLQVPNPPTNVNVDVNPGVATQLKVTWNTPTSDGGDPIRMYRVEYDPSPLFNNRGQQDFWCPAAPTYAVWRIQTQRKTNGDVIENGYFKLKITRNNMVITTEPIPWNAVAMAKDEVAGKIFCTACTGCPNQCTPVSNYPFGSRELSGSMQSKIEYLSTINSVQVSRTAAAAADGGYTWSVTFKDVGDDFNIALDTPSSLTCINPSHNGCNGGTYDVVITKVTNGIDNPVCTGSKVIPSIGALNKGQLYNVRVSAFNKVGFSLPQLAPNPQKPMVVPGVPTGVTLQVLTISELKVLFSPPDDNGGDTIVEYLVEWATDNSFTNAKSGSVVLLSGGAPYYRIISGLSKGIFYFVRVKAKNSQGYGTYQISSPASLNPYTTPSAPTQVSLGITSSTMLTVKWSLPDDDGGDAITGYVVQWDIAAGFDTLGAESTKIKITDVTQRSYTITLLTPGTMYYVRVFAMNSGGLGTPQTSTPTAAIPVNVRPGKPHSLTASATATNGEILVSWQTPRIPAHLIPCSGTQSVPLSCPVFGGLDVVYGGSAFESYLVQWSLDSDFNGSNMMTTVVSTSALLTNLLSGQTYFVRVLTINNQGLYSDFCARANQNGYLCPDNYVLLDGTIVTGNYVSAIPK